MAQLILASGSPRRIELLAHVTPSFEVVPSGAEEAGSEAMPEWRPDPLPLPAGFDVPPGHHPTLWAWRKAAEIARQASPQGSDAVVLGADTVVIAQGALLGKPRDKDHALDMLRRLRGAMHYVATGYSLVMGVSAGVRTLSSGATVSQVWMLDFSQDEMLAYIATEEPMDKAGAYALQGLGGRLVARVEGCYCNVVGLPLCAVRPALTAAGVETLRFPERGYCPGCVPGASR